MASIATATREVFNYPDSVEMTRDLSREIIVEASCQITVEY